VKTLNHAGENPLNAYDKKNVSRKRTTKAKTKQTMSENDKKTTDHESQEEDAWERIKINTRVYFPTRDTVVNSRGGMEVKKLSLIDTELIEAECGHNLLWLCLLEQRNISQGGNTRL
jgi:hypothetical protein